MEREKISVIIPTYNRENTLRRSIDSVLNQTYKNIEIIIIDDCSTDNTKKLIEEYKDKVIYYKLDKNSGACFARNKGVEIATGEYIAFQDSDDEWDKEKLEKQMKVLKETNTEITFCTFNFVNLKGSKKVTKPSRDVNDDSFSLTKELLIKNFISTQTILGKKHIFQEIPFDPELPRLQDWDLVIRISRLCKISYLDEPLVNLYVQKDSITMNNQKLYIAYNIIYKKNKKDIENDEFINYCFKTNIAMALFKTGKLCRKELKESLQIKFNLKVFICYISCITRTNKILLKLQRSI